MKLPLFAITVCVGLLFGGVASAAEFQRDWSGWFMFNSNADIDGSGTGGGEQSLSGTGTFGRADNHAVSDIVFTFDPCDYDGEGDGFGLVVIAHSNILRTRDGDQLFRDTSQNLVSNGCLHPSFTKVKLTVNLDIVGGTGRFENATGYTVLQSEALVFGAHNSIIATEEGEIFGAGKSK